MVYIELSDERKEELKNIVEKFADVKYFDLKIEFGEYKDGANMMIADYFYSIMAQKLLTNFNNALGLEPVNIEYSVSITKYGEADFEDRYYYKVLESWQPPAQVSEESSSEGSNDNQEDSEDED